MYLEEGAVADVREEVVKLLKLLGIKHNLKKADYKPQGETQIEVYHVFKTALELLEKESVLLPQSGVQVEIPVFIIDSCRFIEQNLLVEGLFRKAGSTSKQRELRALLDCGNRLEITDEHHVINVANLLKLFFRELPEPLIPYKFHNTFLRCLSLKQKKVEAILLCCLLLPTDHLNSLAYLLVFLNRVTQQKDFNKMDVGNLAIIFTPNIMPVNAPKLTAQGSVKINRHVLIVQTLIENATLVGVLPEAICDKLGYLNVSTSSTVDMDMSQNVSIKKRRKRRSNSLTKMISGFKKIMSKSSPDFTESMDSPVPNLSAHTPKLILSRKRKNESQGFSSKKKCEMIDMLPGKVILPNTPFKVKYSSTTMLTPRTLISSFKHGSPPQKHKIKHLQPTANQKCTKKNNAAVDMASRKCKNVENKVFETNNGRSYNKCEELTNSAETTSEEYVRIPKEEYESIKKRVNNIENCLDNELENILGVTISDYEDSTVESNGLGLLSNIETAYAKTMEESGKLNCSSVSQKLQRDLRIRRKSDQIIRSPSARKIGSIRRSRENISLKNELRRHSSLNVNDGRRVGDHVTSSRSLRRGRPNTIYTGLPQPSPQVHSSLDLNEEMDVSFPKVEETKDEKDQQNNNWELAKEYFSKNEKMDIKESGRVSVTQIRSQNLGMVLAKAKLYDSLASENLKNDNEDARALVPRNKKGQSPKIAVRNQLIQEGSQIQNLSTRSSSSQDIKYSNVKVRPSKSFNTTSTVKCYDSLFAQSPQRNSDRLRQFKTGHYLSPKKLKRAGDKLSNSSLSDNVTRRKSLRIVTIKNDLK